MRKRSRLLVCSILIASISTVFVFLANAADAKPDGARPNILFAFADDWGRYASAYAALEPGGPNDIVRTPNFDRIAKEGVLFTHAYVNAPSCTPCRSALLSGQYFWRTGMGAILQGATWENKIPSYPLILRDAGYKIGYTYKVWSPGTPRDAPYGGDANGYHQAGRRLNQFSQQVSRAVDKAQARQALLEEARGNFRAFMKARETGKPFCYWFGPTNCHRKWTAGSGRAIWGLNPDDLKGKMPPFLPDVPTVRQDFCDYLGEVQAFDAGLGVLVKELEAIGELDKTLIVVSGDHGIPGFPRGKCNLYDFGVAVPLAIRWPGKVPSDRVVEDFVNLMDLAPTFIEASGQDPPDVMTGRSLLPVLTSKKSGWIDSKRDYVVVGRERHVAKARLNNMPYPQRAIRTKDYLYIRNFKPDRWPMGTAPGFGLPGGPFASPNVLEQNTFAAFGDLDASPTKAWIIANRAEPGTDRYFDYAFGRRPAEELFDLRNDPHQVKNVAAESQYASIREELSARLMTVLKQADDPRVSGDGDHFDNPPFAGSPPAKRKNKKK